MENVKEAVQIIPAIAKGAAVAAKAAAKAAAVAGKAAAKGSKVAAKAGAKAAKGTAKVAKGTAKAAKTGAKATGDAAKGAAKATKPASKNLKFKRPNVKNPKYKDPKTGEFNKDLYDKDRATYKKIKQDQANRPDMSNVKPDGPSDDRTKRGERKLKAIDKINQKKKENIKKRLQDTGDVANKAGDAAKKTGEYAKKSISATSSAFGTSSFRKEGITFKDYLNKL